jgi:predicted nucleic acid-binding protein
MTWLLDGNVLIAMLLPDHPHHERVHRWLAAIGKDRIATCPVTEGTLLRVFMMLASDPSPRAAWEALESVRAHPKHEFWTENFSQPSHRKALLGAEKRAGVELKSLPLGRVYEQNYTNPRQCGRP